MPRTYGDITPNINDPIPARYVSRHIRYIAGFDVDGTLADNTHRLPLINSGTWTEYFDSGINDTPIEPMIEIMKSLFFAGYRIHLFSGRQYMDRHMTSQWLTDNTFWGQHEATYMLHFRTRHDISPAKTMKRRLMRSIGYDRMAIYFDDDINVCEEISSQGIPVYHVHRECFRNVPQFDGVPSRHDRNNDSTINDNLISSIVENDSPTSLYGASHRLS